MDPATRPGAPRPSRLALAFIALGLALAVAACAAPQEASRSPMLQASEDATPLLRTDVTDDGRWASLLARVATPNALGFLALVTPIADETVAGLTEAAIRDLPRDSRGPLFVLVADAITLADDDYPILVVDLSGDARPSFRVTAACLWAVENNLRLANTDWEDFSESVDADGVFRTC